MIINCFYDDECLNPDIIYFPYNHMNIDDLQNNFFKWIFDKNNHHKYWKNMNGILVCDYGTDAFVEWLNNYILKDSDEKAKLLQEVADEWDDNNSSLMF